MITVYTYDYDRGTVVADECEKFGHPHRTVTGATMYENTHFRDEATAWDKLESELRAGMGLASRERSRLQKALEAVTVELADTAQRLLATEEERRRTRARTEGTAPEALAKVVGDEQCPP